MKRLFILLLAATLLAGVSAPAETLQNTIEAEGDAQVATESLFDSGMGFSFRYDATLLEVDASQSEDALSVMVSPKDTDQAVYLELMSADSIGLEPGEYLELYAREGTEYEFDIADAGAEIVGYRQSASFSDAFLQGFYIIRDGDAFVAVATTWPVEADGDWGARLLALLRTVELEDLRDEAWN